MKISIITPTLNHANFIEETIRSVLDQHYSNFEHIIIDGGSKDGTLDILKKYKHLIWISEKDNGQSNAINKGFQMASGEIVAWLNSDDYYEKNTFNIVSEYFCSNLNCMILYGNITYVDTKGKYLRSLTGDDISFTSLLKYPDLVRQPSTFWRKIVVDEIGGLDEKLQLVMDLDFFLRIGRRYKLEYINRNLSYFRVYSEGKTLKYQRKQVKEIIKVLHRNIKQIDRTTKRILLRRYILSFPLFRFLLKKKN